MTPSPVGELAEGVAVGPGQGGGRQSPLRPKTSRGNWVSGGGVRSRGMSVSRYELSYWRKTDQTSRATRPSPKARSGNDGRQTVACKMASDWFLAGMLTAVLLAAAFPKFGMPADMHADVASDVGIFAVFFLHGWPFPPGRLWPGWPMSGCICWCRP